MNSKTKTELASTKDISRKDLVQVFKRSICYNASFNYERQLNLGWAFTMKPILKKLYGDDKDKMAEALNRNLEFNNITPFICTILFGIAIAMEEQNAKDENFDTKSISATKVGLMGSLSAVGDSVFFGTLRIIAAGIGVSLALQGNVFGPILYLIIFNIPNFLSRYYLIFKGYSMGTTFIQNIQKSGLMDKLFKGAAILGLMVIGGMVATMINVPLDVTFYDSSLASVINGIIPNLLSLLFAGYIYHLLVKDVKITHILFGIIVFGILGTGIGLF